MKKIVLRLNNITKSYNGRQVLNIDKLEIYKGEIVCLIGPVGAGKSTLLRLIGLLEKPDDGDITYEIEEFETKKSNEIRKKIAMVFQDSLLLKRTVERNIYYGLKLRKSKRWEREKKLEGMEKYFKIESILRKPAPQLSGGQAQKVSLARALILEPKLLLLDEPFASLDEETKNRLREELFAYLKEKEITTVYVTHDQNEAFQLAERMIVMNEGKFIQQDRPLEIFYHPRDLFIANFVGFENIIRGRIIEQNEGLASIKVNNQQIEAITEREKGEEVFFCLRAEDISISPFEIDRKTSNRNRFKSAIKAIKISGPVVKIELDCGFPLEALITKRSFEELGLENKAEVIVEFKATSGHVISL